MSSMIMIGIIQGLYIIREDEEEELEMKREMAARRRRERAARAARERTAAGQNGSGRKSADSAGPQRQNAGRRAKTDPDGARREGAGQRRSRAGQEEPGRERALRDEQRGSRNKKPTKEKSKFEEVPKQRIR